jgi:molecular chaperone GrpE
VSDELHIEVTEPWGEAGTSPQAGPAEPGTDETEVSPVPGDVLAEVEAQRDEYLLGWQRTQADFDNFRKRSLRQQQEFAARAAERLVTKLLPVLDDLERAIDAAEQHEEAKVIEGVEMTKSALAAALVSEGVEEIVAEGVFDPHVHEALLTQPAEGVDSGVIVQVIQRGYRLGDVVLRPARVIVAE